LSVLSQILYPAFRIAGITLAPQRTQSQSQIADAFACLNSLLDSWLTQRLLVYEVTRVVENVNVGQGSYEIGPGASDWNVPLPERIEFAGLIQIFPDEPTEPPTELPLGILNALDWASVAVKSLTGSTPQKLWYQRGYPIGTVWLWPVPQIANQIALYLWNQIAQFVTPEDTVTLPMGYLRALQYNLAVELDARPWTVKVPMAPNAYNIARESLAWVKTNNRPEMDLIMRCEGAITGEGRGRWDITSNQYHF
jgi:hypothetical protein